MHIAIIGTRGIPNNYGGFEQCAEYLSVGLVKKGFTVTVYNSHRHPFQGKIWNGVNIIHSFDPEKSLGTVGQFIYDFNCIRDCRSRKFDIILQLGYTSNSVWGWLLPRSSIVTTNMDGLEWKRTKFSKMTQGFLQYAEKLAVKRSDYLIADSLGIKEYLKNKYNKDSTYISYGAHLFDDPNLSDLTSYDLKKYEYNLLIARLEPENSVEIILDGVVKSKLENPFLVIGKSDTPFAQYLINKYKNYSYIKFLGGIYDIKKLNSIRYYSNIYFHGHTVGGTNPSLLEAMASNSLICANNNPFNKYILDSDAYYFSNSEDVSNVVNSVKKSDERSSTFISNNRIKVKELYSWQEIIDKYSEHFVKIFEKNGLKK